MVVVTACGIASMIIARSKKRYLQHKLATMVAQRGGHGILLPSFLRRKSYNFTVGALTFLREHLAEKDIREIQTSSGKITRHGERITSVEFSEDSKPALLPPKPSD